MWLPPDSLVQLLWWWGVNEYVGVREAVSLCPKLQWGVQMDRGGVLPRPTRSLWTLHLYIPTDGVPLLSFTTVSKLHACRLRTVLSNPNHDAFVARYPIQWQRLDSPLHKVSGLCYTRDPRYTRCTCSDPQLLQEISMRINGETNYISPCASPWLTQVSSSVPSCQSGDAVSLSVGALMF